MVHGFTPGGPGASLTEYDVGDVQRSELSPDGTTTKVLVSFSLSCFCDPGLVFKMEELLTLVQLYKTLL